MKLNFKIPLIFLIMFIIILLSGTLFVSTMYGELGLKMNVSGQTHMEISLFLMILMGCMLSALSVYFHFKITKPLQLLNDRLKKVKIDSRHTSMISNRKDEIGGLYNHFNEMEERLHQAHKEQLDMIAAIAHDLKTPLTTINGFVELLAMQKEFSEKDRQEYYALILKKSKHISEMINEFFAFTRDALELETLEMKPVNAQKFFECIASEYEIELSGLNFELSWHDDFSPEQKILINEHMLRRVFGNLFSNSVKHSGREDLKIRMSGYIRGQSAYFQVEDNGAGAPDNDLQSLFNKFFIVDKSRQSNKEGMGLGLASCKSILERHGGEIEAFRSNEGGLGICFSLPLIS